MDTKITANVYQEKRKGKFGFSFSSFAKKEITDTSLFLWIIANTLQQNELSFCKTGNELAFSKKIQVDIQINNSKRYYYLQKTTNELKISFKLKGKFYTLVDRFDNISLSPPLDLYKASNYIEFSQIKKYTTLGALISTPMRD